MENSSNIQESIIDDLKQSNIKNNKINTLNSNINNFDIIHYGNHNYYNFNILKIIKKYNPNFKPDVIYYIKAFILSLKKILKNF